MFLQNDSGLQWEYCILPGNGTYLDIVNVNLTNFLQEFVRLYQGMMLSSADYAFRLVFHIHNIKKTIIPVLVIHLEDEAEYIVESNQMLSESLN